MRTAIGLFHLFHSFSVHFRVFLIYFNCYICFCYGEKNVPKKNLRGFCAVYEHKCCITYFTVKSTLNYTRVLRQSTKKKKKKKAINNTQIRRRCMQHLIRTYTVRELIYQIWDRQTVLIKTKKKRKKTRAFKRCILLSPSVKRPFIFWTRRLHLDVLQSQCIHTCHTNGLIIRLPLLMIRVNRLFTAQRSVKC